MAVSSPPPRPRVMVLPFPAQGHVMPLMELSHRLVEHGFEVVFVNTDFNHARILAAMAGETATPGGGGIDLVQFPDGMGPDGDRTDIGKLLAGLPAAMLGGLEETIRSKEIRWVVADVSMSFVLELVPTVGVRVALFSTFSAAIFALRLHVPKMIEDGIIDETGSVKRNERIQLNPKMPAIDATELPWFSLGKSSESRRAMIQTHAQEQPNIQARRNHRLQHVPGHRVRGAGPATHTVAGHWPAGGAQVDTGNRQFLGRRRGLPIVTGNAGRCRVPRPGNAVPGTGTRERLRPRSVKIDQKRRSSFLDPVPLPLRSGNLVTMGLPPLARRAGTRLRRLRGVREPDGVRRGTAPGARRRAGAHRPAVPVGGPAQLRRRRRRGVARRVPPPRHRRGARRRLGSPAARARAPLGGVLRVALRVELDHGRRAARRAVPVLAILRRPVPEPELHLRPVGHWPEDQLRRAGHRNQGGDQGQGGAAARRRGDQSEGVVLEARGVRQRRGRGLLGSGSAEVSEPAKRRLVFSVSGNFLDV
ncbi:unnamed protein product [Urochloa humidicola]